MINILLAVIIGIFCGFLTGTFIRERALKRAIEEIALILHDGILSDDEKLKMIQGIINYFVVIRE